MRVAGDRSRTKTWMISLASPIKDAVADSARGGGGGGSGAHQLQLAAVSDSAKLARSPTMFRCHTIEFRIGQQPLKIVPSPI